MAPGSLAHRLKERFLAQTPSARSQLGWVCLVILLILLGAGLWPLRFNAPNNAGWPAGTNGLHFPGGEARSAFDPGGVVFTPQPLAAAATGELAAGAFSVELWLRPAKEPHSARGRILAVTDADQRELFFVGQWTTQLLVLLRQSEGSGKSAFLEIDLPEALHANQLRRVTVTAGPEGTSFFLDGTLAKRYPGIRLLPASETLAGKLLFLGNSPDGTFPWAGDLLGVALYGRVLTESEIGAHHTWWSTDRRWPPPVTPVALYDLSVASGPWITNTFGARNPLFLPADLRFQKPRLTRFEFSVRDPADLSLNLFGFVPLGFGVSAWLAGWRPRLGLMAVLLTLVAGAAISLAIELIQVYLPMRDSSMTDLVLNTTGTLLGAVWSRSVQTARG